MKYSICLICHKPNPIWVDFLRKFTHYDVYIVVDDNSKDYTKIYTDGPKIIQIPDGVCLEAGFSDMNFMFNKKVTAWEKATYYFSNIEFTHVWFIEDDVYFYNEMTLLNIDKQYINSDLLSNDYNIYKEKKGWNWAYIDTKLDPPFYAAMCCAIRISARLLSKIKNYADQHKSLCFLEVLFPSICKNHGFLYDTPEELKNIVYRCDYKIQEISKMQLYHPVKNMDDHALYRKKMSMDR